jgi:hypothetical protein
MISISLTTSHTSRGSSSELPVLIAGLLTSSSTPRTAQLERESTRRSSFDPSKTFVDSAAADKHARAPDSSPRRAMAAKGMVPILVGMMLLTGCCNTLLTKYQVHSPPATPTERTC